MITHHRTLKISTCQLLSTALFSQPHGTAGSTGSVLTILLIPLKYSTTDQQMTNRPHHRRLKHASKHWQCIRAGGGTCPSWFLSQQQGTGTGTGLQPGWRQCPAVVALQSCAIHSQHLNLIYASKGSKRSYVQIFGIGGSMGASGVKKGCKTGKKHKERESTKLSYIEENLFCQVTERNNGLKENQTWGLKANSVAEQAGQRSCFFGWNFKRPVEKSTKPWMPRIHHAVHYASLVLSLSHAERQHFSEPNRWQLRCSHKERWAPSSNRSGASVFSEKDLKGNEHFYVLSGQRLANTRPAVLEFDCIIAFCMHVGTGYFLPLRYSWNNGITTLLLNLFCLYNQWRSLSWTQLPLSQMLFFICN